MIDTESGILGRLVLNSAQREAVVYEGGPQLVFAGAGTGKTRVLTAKIAWIVDRGASPSRLFAATFTNKAAREMKSRVENYLNRSAENMWIGTFHSLCARLLRKECGRIGFKNSFSIFDSNDQTMLLRKIMQRTGTNESTVSIRTIMSYISGHKNRCIPPGEVQRSRYGIYEQELIEIYSAYQEELHKLQAMDFDDLLMNTVLLLRENPALLEAYQTYFEYILVDEYQDTNRAQLLLMKLLAGRHGRIFAVGDDDQSIYGWRGAQVENILTFEHDFPSVKIFKLEQNYRSSGSILAFANSVIASNSRRSAKRLWTDRDGGERVTVSRYRDDRHEASAIAESIKKLCQGNIRGGEIAVLFRTNAQSRIFEETFIRLRIPYIIVGGISFYERSEVKDALAYIRLLVNRADNISFERIYNTPPRGLGEKALEALSQIASEKKTSLLDALLITDPGQFNDRWKKGFSELRELFELLIDEAERGTRVHELLEESLKISGYMDLLSAQKTEESESRLENINELLNTTRIWSNENPGKGLEAFLEEATLATDVDRWVQREDAVNLMTLHSAKGLEFRIVYIAGCEEGNLPAHQNSGDDAKIEEERRLFYVGVTRAKEKLFCSFVDRRYRFGELQVRSPSRFILETDPSVYYMKDERGDFGLHQEKPNYFQLQEKAPVRFVRSDIPEKRDERKAASYDEEFSQDVVEYRRGQYIKHKNYGRGKIVDISGFGNDMKLTVLFNDGTRRRLMAKFAPLVHE